MTEGMEREYRLLLSGGRAVVWTGRSGQDAAWRYADAHPEVTVLAWQEIHHGMFSGFGPGQVQP